MNPGMHQPALRTGIDRSAFVRGADDYEARIRRQQTEGLDQLLQALVMMEPADETEDPVRALQADISLQPLRGPFHILGIGGEVRRIDSGYVAVANDVKRLPSDGKPLEVTPYALAFWNDARRAERG